MSYAKLNIFIRFLDCRLVQDQWRTDLVIKTCGGTPLIDMDPTVIEKLKERYPDYYSVKGHLYKDEKRINIQPAPYRERKHFCHVEVDVPPGCYVVWTRVCHYEDNEETNKVMVNVRCGEEACVNLLLNTVEQCSKEVLHPLLMRGLELGLPRQALGAAAGVIMAVAEKPKREVLADINERFREVRETQDEELLRRISRIREIVQRLPDRCEQEEDPSET